MPDEDVTPDVPEQAAEADQAHAAAAGDRATPWGGEGNQPPETGYAPPNTGAGEAGESEIPVGVDSIEPVESSADDDAGNAPVDLADLDVGDTNQ
ncbi:MAG TPA: hypothetical protein VM299_02295 [Solirubrobacteraceae bacterium]|jgi:hypothetical protein|nr:hypothetical protein [Solirubrobacteraceae bacterium]